MRKLLDNLHPRNFNHENPGFMLNRESIHAAKNSRYTVGRPSVTIWSVFQSPLTNAHCVFNSLIMELLDHQLT